MNFRVPSVRLCVSDGLKDEEADKDEPERRSKNIEHNFEPEFVSFDQLVGPIAWSFEGKLDPDDSEWEEQDQVGQHEGLPDVLVKRVVRVH